MLDFIGLGNGLINIVLLLVILVALVVIHEFGHFVVARWSRVRVHEFGIGFPPRAKVIGNDGETTYTLNWLPIGGFVRLEGEEGESDDPRAFVRQSLRVRLTILLAGVAMNFLLAFLIFAAIAGLADPVFRVSIVEVQPASPAATAGLVPDDQIVEIDGRRFYAFDGLGSASDPISYLQAHAGEAVTLTVVGSNGVEREVEATLRVPTQESPGALGISSRLGYYDATRDPISAVSVGFDRTVDASTLILRSLGQFITNLGNPPVSGPVGIVGAIGLVREALPPIFMLWFIGLLSANLAVVNALPFPPLDGGRVAISLVQAVTGGRVSAAAERLVYLTGFILLMLLLAWVTLFDTGVLQRQL
jgi:regulator of sigma E protease